MNNKKEVSFPSLAGMRRNTADLLYRVADSVFPSEKRGGSSDYEDRASRGDLLPAGAWRICSVHAFKGRCCHFSWEAERKEVTVGVRGEWEP